MPLVKLNTWYKNPKETYAVKTYGGEGAMQKEIREASQYGWEVVSTTSKTDHHLWKLLIAVVGYWIWTGTNYVVTYKRTAPVTVAPEATAP